MADRRETLTRVIWAMIYSGLLLAGIGWMMLRRESDAGWLLVAFGALDAVVGVALIVVRARMGDAPPG